MVYWKLLTEYQHYYLQGIGYTLFLSFFSVILGLTLGVIMALGKMSKSKILNTLAKGYIEIIRGTPLLVQVFIIYYNGVIEMGPIVAGIIALSLNSSAYTAEIVRAGIQAVDKGQMEASRSLGMTSGMAMKEVILPQAIKNILPALGNEFIVVIKESAVISIIGVGELMRQTNIVRGITFRQIEPLILVAAIYFVLTFSLAKLLGRFERRLKESD
ncbi:amino acid ABC transporter permease [Gottschalkiaceae bacterium SANA]|jgi:polar amino acid transport system permease protein|nr:amino acid ABC transporter permease [Gottschalkiaceae bacterium SANA]